MRNPSRWLAVAAASLAFASTAFAQAWPTKQPTFWACC